MQYKHINKNELSESLRRELQSATQLYNKFADSVFSNYKVNIRVVSRKRDIVLYRKVGAWLFCRYLGYSIPITATVFDKDHSTIIYYLNELDNLFYIQKDRKGGKTVEKKKMANTIHYYNDSMKNAYALLHHCNSFLQKLNFMDIHNGFFNKELCPDIYALIHEELEIPYKLIRENEHKIYVLLLDHSVPASTLHKIKTHIQQLSKEEYYQSTQFILTHTINLH